MVPGASSKDMTKMLRWVALMNLDKETKAFLLKEERER